MPHNSVGVRDETRLENPEVALAQRYSSEIQSLLAELWATLPDYREETGEKTYGLVQDNLGILTDCFQTNALGVQALGVLRDHLWTLSRMVAYRITEAEHQLQRN